MENVARNRKKEKKNVCVCARSNVSSSAVGFRRLKKIWNPISNIMCNAYMRKIKIQETIVVWFYNGANCSFLWKMPQTANRLEKRNGANMYFFSETFCQRYNQLDFKT